MTRPADDRRPAEDRRPGAVAPTAGAPGGERDRRDRPGLDVDARVRLGTFSVGAAARVAAGEVLAIIGANGSGKSTLLGAIAGAHRLDAGVVRLGTRVLSRREAGGADVMLRRSERRVGLLDQRARLFPHLDARANIAFAPRARGASRRAADRLAEEWLDRVGLPGRGGARDRDLSGGQQQRVAIARTLAAEPELLLLDEPFAALDVTSRAELRAIVAAECRRLGIPVVLVSHDPLDLMALADRVLVLESGRVAQEGTVAAVLEAPATPFAAAFTGRALLHGTVGGGGTLRLHDAPLAEVHGRGPLPDPGSTAVASFDPTRVLVSRATAAPVDPGPARNTWRAQIGSVSTGPTGVRVDCAGWPEMSATLPLTRALDAWLAPGSDAHWRLPEDAVRFAAPSQRGEDSAHSGRC